MRPLLVNLLETQRKKERKSERIGYKNREAAKDVEGSDSGGSGVLELSWLRIVEQQRLWISHSILGAVIVFSVKLLRSVWTKQKGFTPKLDCC